MAGAPKNRNRQMVGWREWASLPNLGIDFIDAKIDTGAKSSVIGAFEIRQQCVAGRPMVEFGVRAGEPGKESEIFCLAPYAGTRIIRSSNGQEQERLLIDTQLGLGDRLWKVEMTLADRDAMDFQMLIGREVLGRKFLINPAASYLLGR